jgi:hypothetical protein
MGGMGRRLAALVGGELRCEAVGEEILNEGGSFEAMEIYEEGRAQFYATT